MSTEIVLAEVKTNLPEDPEADTFEYTNEDGEVVEYDVENRLSFSDPKEEPIPSPPPAPGQKPQKPIMGMRINIQDKTPSGKLQDLMFRTEELFSFGISDSKDQATGVKNGYTLPLCLWNQEGATVSQKYFTDLVEGAILEKIKKFIVANRKALKRGDLELNDLRKMKIFYRKKDENGNVNMSDAPTWYPKLIVQKKKDLKIISRFYLMDSVMKDPTTGEMVPPPLDAEKLKGTIGKCRAVVKIESIWLGPGKEPAVQCKVWEADFKPTVSALPRKGRVNKNAVVIESSDNNPMTALLLSNKKKPETEKKEEESSEKPTDKVEAPDAGLTAEDGSEVPKPKARVVKVSKPAPK